METNHGHHLVQASFPTASMPGPEAPRRLDFQALARAEWSVLLSHALRLTRNADDACDLVQDTFERAMKAERKRVATGGALPASPGGWLLVILRNLFVDRCRSEQVRRCRPLTDDVVVAVPAFDEVEDVPAWQQLSIDDVEACLPRLSVEIRAAFELLKDGVSHAEIAVRLHIPPQTVCTRIHRARRCLRGMLGGDRGSTDRRRAPHRSSSAGTVRLDASNGRHLRG